MIDISVTDLVKSFDLEKKILDGVSFQIDTGERVGLLGKNGAGKSTLFNILTGELDYDSGQVLIAPGRRVGLISQIPVYPAGYTVEDVLRSAFQRTTALKEEMDRLTRQMEQGDSDPQTLQRYGELTARFEGLGGYDTDTAVNKVSNGLSIDGDMRRQTVRPAVRRGEDPGEPGPPDPGGHGHSPAGRAHQPSGPAGHRVAGGVYPLLPGHRGHHLPRPLFPGPHRHPHHRDSGR